MGPIHIYLFRNFEGSSKIKVYTRPCVPSHPRTAKERHRENPTRNPIPLSGKYTRRTRLFTKAALQDLSFFRIWKTIEAQWDSSLKTMPVFATANTHRHFFASCEGAGTNNSFFERGHENFVRIDKEELPTAAFMLMNVTVIEELRFFGVAAGEVFALAQVKPVKLVVSCSALRVFLDGKLGLAGCHYR